MKNQQEQFCATFFRAQQLADEKGLNRDNTVLNKSHCPFAQGCLGLSCQLLSELKNNPPYRTIYLKQNTTSSHSVSQTNLF